MTRPEDPTLTFLEERCRTWLREERGDRLLEMSQAYLDAGGDTSQGMFWLAMAQSLQGDPEAARATMRRSVEAAPDVAMRHLVLADLCGEAEVAEREASLWRAVALDPDLARAWAELATTTLWLQDADASLRCAERALALDPGEPTARVVLPEARHALGLGSAAEVLQAIDDRLARDPDDAWAQDRREVWSRWRARRPASSNAVTGDRNRGWVEACVRVCLLPVVGLVWVLERVCSVPPAVSAWGLFALAVVWRPWEVLALPVMLFSGALCLSMAEDAFSRHRRASTGSKAPGSGSERAPPQHLFVRRLGALAAGAGFAWSAWHLYANPAWRVGLQICAVVGAILCLAYLWITLRRHLQRRGMRRLRQERLAAALTHGEPAP